MKYAGSEKEKAYTCSCKPLVSLERETGFEPATLSLEDGLEGIGDSKENQELADFFANLEYNE